MPKKSLLRIYSFSIIGTILIFIGVGIGLGLSALLPTLILTVLEITFSADNAVINSKILKTMSDKWKTIFLTVGIIIAVFIVRMLLPIIIVMLSSGNTFIDILYMAFNQPNLYSSTLHSSEPYIGAFGGTFLIMVAIEYFLDNENNSFWFSFLEKPIARFGRYKGVSAVLSLCIILFLSNQLHNEANPTFILQAAIYAVLIHYFLNIISSVMAEKFESISSTKYIKTGFAAFASFIYLEVIDSSFSLDGVIGAFAISNSVIIIAAGLACGALFVRAMTIHLVQNDTLAKFPHLESGAHYAIAFLGISMYLRTILDFEIPEAIIGFGGLFIIIVSILTSLKSLKK